MVNDDPQTAGLLDDARHRQAVPGCSCPRRRGPRHPRRRGALPARAERRGQVHAHQGARRRAPAGRGPDPRRRRAGHDRAPGRRADARHRDDVPGARRRRRPVRRGEHLPGPRALDRRVLPAPLSDPEHPQAARAPRPPSGISPRREVGTLSAAGKQIVSMARALSHDARVIVMDEPSAVLDSEEVAQPLPRGPGPDGRRRGRRLHLPPARGDPPDRRPDHRAQGRPHRRERPRGGRHPDRGAHPPDDRPQRRVRHPAPPAGAPTTPPTLVTSRTWPCAGRSATSRSTCAPGRSSGSRGWSAQAVGDPRDRLRRSQGDERDTSRSTAPR